MIDFIHVNLSELETKINIGDMLYIDLNNVSPYITMQITDIIYKSGKDKLVSITAQSKSFELYKSYAVETIQYAAGTSIKTIIEKLGFNAIGDNFNLLYTSPIILEIGTNISEFISALLTQHGYIFVSDNGYNIKIEKIINDSSHVLDFYESFEYHKKFSYKNISIFSDTYSTWDFKAIKSAKGAKVVESLYLTDIDSLKTIKTVYENREKRKSLSLKITTFSDIVFYCNSTITIENLPEDIENNIFYINGIRIIENGLVELNLQLVK